MKAKKIFYFFAVAALSLAMAGCNPDPLHPNNSLVGKWMFVKVENKATAEITVVPQTFDIFDEAYLVEFKENGTLEFTPHCNYQTGNYVIENQNVIKFNHLGYGTEMCCGSFTDWEGILINNLSKSLTYSITDNFLIIDCTENKLYFEKEPPQNIIGCWINPSYEDNSEGKTLVNYEKSDTLPDNSYGIKFVNDGTLIERKNSGWCGTPPIAYGDFVGTWQINNDSVIIDVAYWGGMEHLIWQIIKVTDTTLKIEVLSSEYSE